MQWTDAWEIAIALMETHPDVDPRYVRYTDMHAWICALPDFDDAPEKSMSEFWKPSKWRGWKKSTKAFFVVIFYRHRFAWPVVGQLSQCRYPSPA